MSMSRTRRYVGGFWSVLLLVTGLSLACSAAIAGDGAGTNRSSVSASVQDEPSQPAYTLGSGDKLKVVVYGENDLSGEFNVDGSGNVRLPLIGQIAASGLTVKQLEASIAKALAGKYLVNPNVSVEVVTFRPFTILGEVNRPGEYPYQSGMTVLQAVAIAGGYTLRANEDTVMIRKKGSASETEAPADDKTTVAPGDTVRVRERIF